jgi:hypothetical protein
MERYRTTLILVAVLVVLGVAAFVLNNREGGTGGTPTPTVNTVFVWQETNPVIGIDVVSGTQRVSLSKNVTTTVWSILEPISETADVFAVGNLADQAQNLTAQTELTGTTDLAPYGLAGNPMQATFTFGDSGKTNRTLLIGDTTPDGGAFYVKRADSPAVFLITSYTLEPLRTWLTTPPIAQPTPTSIPLTVLPTSPVTGTVTVTATEGLTGTLPITNTGPGAANPTTPEAPTTQPTGTTAP